MDTNALDNIIDLSNTTFDEFVRFWFDRLIDPRAISSPRDADFA